MNRAGLAMLIGAVLGSGVCSQRATGTERAGKELAQATEESVSLASGTALHAELDTPVDSKKAKAGDAVTAHVTEAVKVNGQTVVPKNTKLVGHVTQASARAKGDAGSTLAIAFDKAVIKKGQEVSLRAVIVAMAVPPRFPIDASPDTAHINDGPGAAAGSPMRAARPSPDQNAAAVGSAENSGEKPAGLASHVGAGLDSAGRLSSDSRGVFGLEGLHLSADASSATAGSLITTSGKSVHVDSGVRLILISE